MKYSTTRMASLTQSSIFVNCCQVNQETPYHAHNFIEIAYVLKGNGYHIIDKETHPVKSGTLSIMNPNIPHKFIAESDGLTIYNCVFMTNFLDHHYNMANDLTSISQSYLLEAFCQENKLDSLTVVVSGETNRKVYQLYEQMLQEFINKDIGYQEILRGYLLELLVMIFRQNNNTYSPNHDGITEALQYIRLNYKESIPLSIVSKLANLSVTDFCRKFKKTTGKTVTTYIQTLRIEEACNLLITTDMKILAIMNEIGYSDSKHFYQLFKRYTGKIPSDFRQ